MTISNWQLREPIDAIIFDCDGTLSAIEGIDQLADWKGVGEEVNRLTQTAMGKTGLNPDVYQQRLQLVKPSYDEVLALGLDYYRHKVPHIETILRICKLFSKAIFIVSAGLSPAVTLFAEQLTIPTDHVYSVNIRFDRQHHYVDFDHDSPLIHNDGKKKIVATLLKQFINIIYVGDGLNDLSVMPLVKRFVGYGGSFYREQIAKQCEFYIMDYLALLPLLLTKKEIESLTKEDKKIFQEGMKLIEAQSKIGS